MKVDAGISSAHLPRSEFVIRVLILFASAIAAVLLLAFLFYAGHILLIVFGGVMFGLFVSTPADWLAANTKLGRRISILLVLTGLILVVVSLSRLLLPSIQEQMVELESTLPQAVEELEGRLRESRLGRSMLSLFTGAANENGSQIATRVTGAFSSAASAAVTGLLMLFIGIYLAAERNNYVTGVLLLIPRYKRRNALEIIHKVAYVLRWWLFGQMVSMFVLGVLISLGLYLLDIPLALTFGLFAAVLTFIPNIGPIISAVPPLVIAFSMGTGKALAVAALYVVVQNLEGYLITPLVQRKAVDLPPALGLTAQVVLYLTAGFLGLLFAVPIAAALMVVVRILFVRDTLGEDIEPVKQKS